MHGSPDPTEILALASQFVRNTLVPALPADLAFNARVLANALDLVSRQITEEGSVATEYRSRLTALLNLERPENELLVELVHRIDSGEIGLDDSSLIDHLWLTTLAKLAVDQPRYVSYRVEMESGDTPPT